MTHGVFVDSTLDGLNAFAKRDKDKQTKAAPTPFGASSPAPMGATPAVAWRQAGH